MIRVKDAIVLEEAAEDLAEAFTFYEAQDQGLGPYFFESLMADIDSLLVLAGAHGMHHGFHRMLAKRFPFAIYYDVVNDLARVAAVLDMRRDPAWTRRELEGRRE